MISKWLGTLGIIVTTFLLCTQFSSQNTSTVGKEKPSTNVFGLITDADGQSYPVENITIAGRFKDIPLYKEPTDASTNPEINKTLVDLCVVSEIRIPVPKIVEYNKRKYVEIIIVSNNATTQNNYIIEYSKRLFCDYGLLEKELNFTALKNVVIQGCRSQEERPRTTYQAPAIAPLQVNQVKDQQALDATITKTQSLIADLEKKAEKLSGNEQDKTLKTQILQTIADLRASVQETIKNWFA